MLELPNFPHGPLEYLACYDSLTGLLNREEIVRQLSHAIKQPDGPPVAVLYIDLDRIKWVNDTMGHAAGDEAIREGARRIQTAVRGADRVGRHGGDEFVVLAPGIRNKDDAAKAARRILEHLGTEWTLAERTVHLSATIGIFLGAERLGSAEECLRRADVALYHGKQTRRGTWWFYAEAMDVEQRRHIDLVGDLRRALADEALAVEYQPKIELATGRMVGVEALVRWQHPTEGWVPPDWFVHLAEEANLIDRLGDQVLRRACADLAAWQAQDPGRAPQHVAVNVSGRQLAGDALCASVWGALNAHGLDVDALELEITEHVFYAAKAQVLERLSASGIRLSIDDYGKGYSSLLVLRDAPAKVVKVDRSFVSQAERSESDRIIVEHAIQLAHSLGRTVVAEGVETAEQLAMLRRMHCDVAQGYYLARPMAADAIPAVWHRQW